MQFRRVRALRGPNVWARVPVLEATVELREWDRSSDQFPGFAERLLGWLPSLAEHRAGFVEDLRHETDLGALLAQLTLELQAQAGTPVGFGQSAGPERGVRSVAVAYEYEALGRVCLEAARQLCLAALHDRPFDVMPEIRRLRALEFQLRPGPGTRAIIRAARAWGIPVQQLVPPPGNLLQLGYGAKQRRASNARTDRTGSIAQAISQDKELTRTLLAEAGLPVPEGRPVADAEDAWEAARQLGPPVVVKPQDQDNGRGVALNLLTRQQVYAAYEAARRESPNVLVERQAPGWHHRLLVIGGRLVA